MSLWKRLSEPRRAVNTKVLELETAKEILAEVFGVKLSDVDEMIENRFQAGEGRRSRVDNLWPQELWVEG